MRKTYKFRIYPNAKQIININSALSQACYVYNQLIEKQKTLYEIEGKKHSRYGLSNISKEIDTPKLYSQVKQNISSRIDESYKLFFSNIKRKVKASPPKFKSWKYYSSLTYPQSGFKITDNKIKLSRLGNIDLVKHREIEGETKTVTIKKLASGDYYIFVSCDEVSPKVVKDVSEDVVGIDIGIKEFSTLSSGLTISYPQFFRKSSKKLAKEQRRLSKKKKKGVKVGNKISKGKNRNKARIKVARVHQKITQQRHNFFFKVANVISNNFKYVGVEDLRIKNMLKNHKLAKSISDNAWGEFMSILDFKLKEKGGEMVKVNARNTTKECSCCGNIKEMNLSIRTYDCSNCGSKMDRDYNASINIKQKAEQKLNLIAEGHSVIVFGDMVRPHFTFVDEANVNELETSFVITYEK